MSLEDLRRQYTLGGLDEANVPDDPIELFGEWMQAALDNSPADWVEPYAMTVATASPTGDVSSRIVLLRDLGLSFTGSSGLLRQLPKELRLVAGCPRNTQLT